MGQLDPKDLRSHKTRSLPPIFTMPHFIQSQEVNPMNLSIGPTESERLIKLVRNSISNIHEKLILSRMIKQIKQISQMLCTILSPSKDSLRTTWHAEIIKSCVFLPNFQYLKQSLSIFFMNSQWKQLMGSIFYSTLFSFIITKTRSYGRNY